MVGARLPLLFLGDSRRHRRNVGELKPLQDLEVVAQAREQLAPRLHRMAVACGHMKVHVPGDPASDPLDERRLEREFPQRFASEKTSSP